ncbi:hypothetical protein [Pseudogemmobacter faecipullorum]|uniref:Uncharacterized protein n=1 Tax=Pseudogemmobacter faecipullorum TaxID=2755041 RepID=A0ABS8CQV5_9RHOB|nr:hypothetical protein [Pseudogemmobacter faecipullorum]MCB5411746.1 hypothetical protein [Pseudogemmobacter faecipullorum]
MFKALTKFVSEARDLPAKLMIAATVAPLTVTQALAQEGAANVRGALQANQSGLEAVAGSSFTGEGAQQAATNFTNVLLYGAGAIGIALVIVGIYQLWKHQKEGDQARGSAGQGIAMIVIGGLMTIPAIVTAIAPQILVGAGS